MKKARIEQQTEKVLRLARELRFELLLLKRMRTRSIRHAPQPREAQRFGVLADVYAAALLRRAAESGGDAIIAPDVDEPHKETRPPHSTR